MPAAFLRVAPGGVPDLARPDFAEVQVRRQARGSLGSGKIPLLAIGLEALLQEPPEQALRRGASGRPRVPQSPGPVDPGQQAESFGALGGGPARWRREGRGRPLGLGRIRQRQAMPPKGREDLKRGAGPRLHRPWFVQQGAVIAVGLDPGGAERGLEILVACDGGGFVAPVPDDADRAALPRQRQQRGQGLRLRAQREARAAPGEILPEALEAVVQPPSRRRSGSPRTFLDGRVYIHGNDGRARLERRGESRVVGEPQILSKPYQSRHARHFGIHVPGRGGFGYNSRAFFWLN